MLVWDRYVKTIGNHFKIINLCLYVSAGLLLSSNTALTSETFYATYEKHAICMSESYCPVWTIHHASNALTIA